MLLVRPSSLPHLPWNPVALVPIAIGNPLAQKVKISVRLAQVQDGCLCLMAKTPDMQGRTESGIVSSLEAELQDIHRCIMELYDEWTETTELKLEWDTLNFTLYAVLTAVLRLDAASLHNCSKREECLLYARKALLAMQGFQANVSCNATTDFFSWTVLLYPLTPFFVVFCNVVATSNLQDLELLTSVTGVMSQIKEQCTLSMNLFKLFTQFIQLCGHLNDVQSMRRQPDQLQAFQNGKIAPELGHPQSTGLKTSGPEPNPRMPTAPVSILLAPGYQSSEAADASPSQAIDSEGITTGTVWDNERLWQLFNMQPSIESFDLTSFDIL
ncbi:hypothetical protein ACHAPJ_011514 [Fusarium lateritium]